MRRTLNTGVKISYNIRRNKSNHFLVFIHGVGGDSNAWDDVVSRFKDYSTIQIDLRGHGKSERPKCSRDYSFDLFASDIKKVLDYEGIDDFIIIGHSFGGMVVLHFSHLYPHFAKGYVFAASSYKFSRMLKVFSLPSFVYSSLNHFNDSIDKMYKEKKKKGMLILVGKLTKAWLNVVSKYNHKKRDYNKFRMTPDISIPRLWSDISHTSLKSWVFTYHSIYFFNGYSYLNKISEPTLIIHGKRDLFVPEKVVEIVHKRIKHSKVVEVDNAGHIVVLSHPKEVHLAIKKFADNVFLHKNF